VGKSTLIKCITKQEDYQGQIEYGHNVRIGYFAQDAAEQLDPEKTVFKTIDDIAVGEKRKDIRSILGAFLFSGEESEKQVKVLSGGERTRLAICKLLFEDFNFLIMDEPTNHLDIQSKEILKDALNNYEGTLLLVSHDREFLDGLSNKIWEIRDGRVRTHHFGVNDFLKRLDEEERSMQNNHAKKEQTEKVVETKEETVESKTVSREDQVLLKKLDNKIKKWERRIEELEIQLKEETKVIDNTPYDDSKAYKDLLDRFNKTQKDLEHAMETWEASEMEKAELESKL
jgi:ATP-binding cassette subfamily F protein 3